MMTYMTDDLDDDIPTPSEGLSYEPNIAEIIPTTKECANYLLDNYVNQLPLLHGTQCAIDLHPRIDPSCLTQTQTEG